MTAQILKIYSTQKQHRFEIGIDFEIFLDTVIKSCVLQYTYSNLIHFHALTTDTCVNDTCVNDTCVNDTCLNGCCVDTCVNNTCVNEDSVNDIYVNDT